MDHDYVHLNPARAGLVSVRQGLESYPWSSLGYYLRPPRERQGWQQAGRGLACWQQADEARGRRSYLEHLEGRVRAEGAEAGRALPEGQSLQSTLSRGWFFGREAFREKLLALAKAALRTGRTRPSMRAAEAMREHHQERAAALIRVGMEWCGLDAEELQATARGDERKALIALAVKRETTVPLDWIAQRLQMGARSTVSREVAAMAKRLASEPDLAKLYQAIVTAEV